MSLGGESGVGNNGKYYRLFIYYYQHERRAVSGMMLLLGGASRAVLWLVGAHPYPQYRSADSYEEHPRGPGGRYWILEGRTTYPFLCLVLCLSAGTSPDPPTSVNQPSHDFTIESARQGTVCDNPA